MRKTIKVALVTLLVLGVSTSSFAGDLQSAISNASQVASNAAAQAGTDDAPIPKGYLTVGAGLFVAGMALAVNGFLNNRNGDFPEFGEATSTNVKMGAAGLAAAFAGGAVLFLGKHRASRSPSITFGGKRVTVTQRVSW
jgi:hypothetical protein